MRISLLHILCGAALLGAADAIVRPSLLSAQTGTITGVVRDSLSERALGAADVQLVRVGAPAGIREGRTDSAGSFHFDDVAVGEYLIGFNHAVLDSLGLDPVSYSLTLASGERAHIELAIPSGRTLVERLCKTNMERDSTGLFIGNVRNVGGTTYGPRSELGVRVSWTELRISRFGVETENPAIDVKPGPGGFFALCAVPLSTPIMVRAWQGADSTGLIELEIPNSGLMRRDLYVGPASTSMTYTVERTMRSNDGTPGGFRYDTTAAVRTARGTGSLRGTVRLLNGGPVDAVRVELPGTGLATSTGSDGTFVIDSVPLGSQTVVARLIGLAPHRGVVDVLPDRKAEYDITLAPVVTTLESVRVTVPTLRQRWMEGFEARRTGPGTHYDTDYIAQRNPFAVADLVRVAPGVDVIRSGVFRETILMRRTGGRCEPAVFIDGLRMTQDFLPDPAFVVGVEVYHRLSLAPFEFSDQQGGCGSIVIWTGQRP